MYFVNTAFRLGTKDHTAQCLMEIHFLGSMDHNCNKLPRNLFLDEIPDYRATVYLAQRLTQNQFSRLILQNFCLRMYALGKDLVELLEP